MTCDPPTKRMHIAALDHMLSGAHMSVTPTHVIIITTTKKQQVLVADMLHMPLAGLSRRSRREVTWAHIGRYSRCVNIFIVNVLLCDAAHVCMGRFCCC